MRTTSATRAVRRHAGARGFFYDGGAERRADYGMTERVKVAVGIAGRKRERVFALRKTRVPSAASPASIRRCSP